MTLLELIFALLAKFVPMDSVRLLSLQKDGKLWYDEIDEADESTPSLVRKLKEVGEKWYTQVAFAISFIFLQRIIVDFLNPAASDEDDEDDE
jgi:hypothetical protein